MGVELCGWGCRSGVVGVGLRGFDGCLLGFIGDF